jgi:hypothetical protein
MIIPHEPCFLRLLSKLVAVAALAVAAGVASAAGVPRDNSNGRQMYQGASMTCLVANDFYAVHFTALQEGRHEGEQTDFVKYCQEVPRPGKTYLTLDLLDRDVRSMPVSLRVVEEEPGDDGRPPKEKRTLVETLATVYKSGTAEIQADITEPGHYAVIAVFGENDGFISEDDRLRVPFSVGIASPNQPNRWPGAVFALVIAILVSVVAWRVYRGLQSRLPARAANEDGERPAPARQAP